MKLKNYILMIICLTATACVSVLYGDFKIRGGTIINQNSGPLVFDLTNDGNANVTMSANGKMGFGSSAPTSTFDLTGSLGLNSQVFSADGAISGNSMIFGDTSVGSISLTLPSPSTVTGRIYHIKKISENNSLIITSSTNEVVPFIRTAT
jgi:hypothetical protein